MTDIEINEREMFEFFKKLKDELDDQTLLKALTAGGMILRDSAKARLLKKFPKASSAVGREKDNINMAEGVRISKRKNSVRPSVNVYIMGNFMNRWFELGTKDRTLLRKHKKDDKHHRTYKKGENRGKITGLHFFKEAKDADLSKVTDKIKEVVEQELKKIFDE